MPILNSQELFTDLNISLSPDSPGVYALWNLNEIIYYGSSARSIRSRLQRHKNGSEGSCTRNATHFQAEVSVFPSVRESELIREFQNQYGRLPRCNDVMP